MTAKRFISAVIVTALPALALAQVPPIQSPPGMMPDASNAVLPNALSNLGALPHVASNTALSAKSNASAPQGLYRDHYAAGGFADGSLLFMPQSGSCASNGWVNDGGNCVDSTSGDGNSWKALHRNNILNVREFGALGNGSNDDTAAIQAAVNAAGNAAPGVFYDLVVFPSGNYCISTAGGVTAAGSHLTLVGYGNAIVKVCGAHDTTVLTLNGNNESIQNLSIQGYNSPTVTQSALVLGSGCVECYVDTRTFVQYGYTAIASAAPDAKIWAKATQAYGPAIAQATAGGFWQRNKFDQSAPTGAMPTAPYTLSAWAASTGYAKNALVTIGSGAWLLQETAASCTSGSGSEPAVAAYGTNITDNNCTWQLAAPATYYALEFRSSGGPAFVDKLDATGVFTYSVALDNTGGGSGPQLVTLRDINAGQALSGGVLASAGQGLFIDGGSATNCILAGCAGVNVVSTWGQNLRIGGGFMAYGNPYGIWLGGGTGVTISGASIHGASTSCIEVRAGVSDFSIVNNDLTTGAIWGNCAASIKVDTGSSDRYTIADNLVSGTAPSDGGSGANKTIIGNH